MRFFGVVLFSGMLFLYSIARADTQSYSYVTDALQYTTTPGGAVTALVYLKESGTIPLIADEGGLLVAGFSVTRASSGLPASPSTISSLAGSVTSNGDNFPGGNFVVKPAGTASFKACDNLASLDALTGPVPVNGLIEIGSVTLTGGTTPGSTSFTLGNVMYPSATGGFTATFAADDYDLDVTTSTPVSFIGAGGPAGAESFSVVVTPEPASLALFAFAAATFLLRRPAHL